jgi:hypothetical protein
MKRHLLNVLTALSLLLCVAVVSAWVRSFWASENVGYAASWDEWSDAAGMYATRTTVETGFSAGMIRGEAWLTHVRVEDTLGGGFWFSANPRSGPERLSGWYRTRGRPRSTLASNSWDWHGAGFALRRARVQDLGAGIPASVTGRYAAVVIPAWFLATLTAAQPAVWVTRRLRLRRKRQRTLKGLCPRCGYDLRATPKRCPECGVRR